MDDDFLNTVVRNFERKGYRRACGSCQGRPEPVEDIDVDLELTDTDMQTGMYLRCARCLAWLTDPADTLVCAACWQVLCREESS